MTDVSGIEKQLFADVVQTTDPSTRVSHISITLPSKTCLSDRKIIKKMLHVTEHIVAKTLVKFFFNASD